MIAALRFTSRRTLAAAAALFAILFFFGFAGGFARADTSAFPSPVIVVYPFTVSGNTTDAQAGGNVAVLLATRLQSLGGLTVKPFTPGTTRPQFYTAAVAQNADYYVTGFLTPIGSEVSLITQVVSTYGGIVVWSNTSTIRTYEDALGEADGLRAAILNHAQRGTLSIGAQPAATPVPSSSDAAGVNLTNTFFRHHRSSPPSAATPAPSASANAAKPATVALASKPATGAMVVNVGGDADATLRGYAGSALATAVRRAGINGGTIAVSGVDAVTNAASLCRANPGNGALYVGTLASNATPPSVSLEVTAYDCAGRAVATEHDTEPTGKRTTPQSAIDRAAAKIAQALARR